MKHCSGWLPLLLAPLMACEGPAIPGLMFGERTDAGPEIITTVDDAGPGEDNPLNPGGIPIDCAELTRCMASCSGARCGPQCLQRADTRTQEIYSQVSICAANHECRDPDCIQDNCTEPWLDCQEDIHPSERPNCASLRNCARGCGQQGECMEACQNGAHQSTVQRAATVSACSQSANCADEACRRNNCSEALVDCYSNEEASRMTCAELIHCLETCGEPGACQEDCRAHSRTLARTNLDALDDCRIACGPDPAECRRLCPIEFGRCDP